MNPSTMKAMCQAVEEMNLALKHCNAVLRHEGDSLFVEHGESEIRIEVDPFAGYFRLDLL